VRAPFIAISDVTEYEYTEGKEGSCDVYTVVVSSALYRLLDPNSMREVAATSITHLQTHNHIILPSFVPSTYLTPIDNVVECRRRSTVEWCTRRVSRCQ
jgi:hypothetical protein